MKPHKDDTPRPYAQRVSEGLKHLIPPRLHLPRMLIPRLTPRRSHPGAAPGIEHEELAAMPAGEGRVYVSCIDYCADQFEMRDILNVQDFLAAHRPDWCTVRWINIDGLTDPQVIHAFAKKYQLHPLAVEDVMHIPQRPKVDPYPQADGLQARLFISARMMQMTNHHLHREQISIFLGHNTILTFQESHGDVWDPIRERIARAGSRIRTNDASFLAYALVDAIIDHCFPIVEHYGDRLELLEMQILDHPEPGVIHGIHALKRELLLLRREVWPMREMISALQREEHECMSAVTRTYLRDVYDHAVQIIDIIETYREMATGLADTYMTAISNRMNEVMKVLTIIATIFIPITFLAGIYGMNFDILPELHWRYGYAGFWGVCIVIVLGLLFYFRRKKWL